MARAQHGSNECIIIIAAAPVAERPTHRNLMASVAPPAAIHMKKLINRDETGRERPLLTKLRTRTGKRVDFINSPSTLIPPFTVQYNARGCFASAELCSKFEIPIFHAAGFWAATFDFCFSVARLI